jgi:hypothetical protein
MAPDNGFDSPDDGAAGPDQSAFEAPPEEPSNGAPDAGPKPKKPGKADQGGAADPDSPADISQRLAAEASGEAGHTRHGANGEGTSGVDEAAPSDAAASDAIGDPNATPEEAPELLPGFDEATTAPSNAPPDETTLDAVEPPLNQAGHTDQGSNKKQALWVTAIAFGALLLVSAGWLWTRRDRRYDPA